MSEGQRDSIQFRAQDDDDDSPARRAGAWLYQRRAGVVLDRCSVVWNGGNACRDEHCESVRRAVAQLQSEGMYVLALARQEVASTSATTVEHDLTFLGLQALMDPPRPEAAEAIARRKAQAFAW